MNLYCYVIDSDAGVAPNYDPPFTTLAICKPRIRKGGEVGDVVLAFTGNKLSVEPHAVRWAGVIAEKLTFTEYWHDPRFSVKKPAASDLSDNIYKPRRDGYGFDQIENTAHGPGNQARNLGGQYVLVMDPCWRFCGSAPVLPADFGYRISLLARRNHRRYPLTRGAWRRLKGWLDDRQIEMRGGSPEMGLEKCVPPVQSCFSRSRVSKRRPRC